VEGAGEVASARGGRGGSGQGSGEGGEWEIGRCRREGGPGGCDARVGASEPFVGYI
jgi:hypothetical protein